MVSSPVYIPMAHILLYLNGAKVNKGLKVRGKIVVNVTRSGTFEIGQYLSINSGSRFNVIGRQQRTIFWVGGELIIGNHVGMSSVAIICRDRIRIGDNVTIGGNTVIYDTDFHSINPEARKNQNEDRQGTLSSEVVIEDNAFIGAHTTILKGVTIGKNAVVGACSLVSKDIPPNEIWGGNPAKFLKKITSVSSG